MKNARVVRGAGILLVACIVVIVVAGCAGTMQTERPGAIVVDEVTSTATVTAIDPAKRAVTLKFEDGSMRTYKLSEAVKNFDQIQVGDKVKSTYVESVAILVMKADGKPTASQTQSIQVAAKGEKPGVVVSNTYTITSKVEAIDYDKRTVGLRGPDGNLNTFSVDKSAERFNEVKVGDDVVIQVTEATMIAVEKP
jgi:hypothetical protein